MIEYINISFEEYSNLSDEKIKKNSYCIEYRDGTKDWIVNDKYHREDGPAIEWIDGSKYWYINDIVYSFEEWLKITPLSNEEKIFLRLKYGN